MNYTCNHLLFPCYLSIKIVKKHCKKILKLFQIQKKNLIHVLNRNIQIMINWKENPAMVHPKPPILLRKDLNLREKERKNKINGSNSHNYRVP